MQNEAITPDAELNKCGACGAVNARQVEESAPDVSWGSVTAQEVTDDDGRSYGGSIEICGQCGADLDPSEWE
jgi:hypothetical protein